MNKKQKSVLMVYAIIFVVFNLLFFIIPFTRTPSVWVMFLFSDISVALGYGITHYAFKDTQTLRSKVYGFPVFRISYIYTLLQLLISFIIFIVNIFIVTPLWLSATISILLLAFALIGAIAADNARDIIEEVDNTIEYKTRQMKTFRLDLAYLVDKCDDKETKKLLEKLSDKLKYSDPVSSTALEDIENKISETIAEISNLIDGKKYEELRKKIILADGLTEDRNRRCKAEKQNQ